MSDPDVLRLFAILEAGGCRAPDVVGRDTALAIEVWRGALTESGLDTVTAMTAAIRYVGEPTPDGYPKPWPSPGHLVARSQAHRDRRAALAGAEALFERAVRCRSTEGPRVDPSNVPVMLRCQGAEATALTAGIAAIGGWAAMGGIDERGMGDKRRAFVAAYQGALSAAPLTAARQVTG